ncbi:hypothetical protein I7I48_06743 [Histoplasma ohiense]|nr:hypothetical protein I7I48_06743 [Histoplasma ohiense (nom. inval.)]
MFPDGLLSSSILPGYSSTLPFFTDKYTQGLLGISQLTSCRRSFIHMKKRSQLGSEFQGRESSLHHNK